MHAQMKGYFFFRDEHGNPRVFAADGARVFCDFLEGDVQGCIGDIGLFLDAVLDVKESGKSWQATGNAHTVEIGPKRTRIFNEYTEEMVVLSSVAFEQGLKQWLALLRGQK